MDAMESIIKNLDWSPLFISLKTGIVATFISFFLGIYAARKVVKTTPGKKAVIDGILTLPMVLPPTVAGFFLLLIFSKRRPFGIFLYETFDIKVVQSWLGCIIAATVIAFPLMYRNARAAFEQLDVNLIYAGRTLGMSDIRIFWKVVIPSAGPGIASGTILTFARALGEYGATSMLAGNIPGKTGTDFSENCYGHSGWRLCNSGSMGSDCYAHRISCNLFHEFYIRHKDEEYQTLVDPVKQHSASSVCCLSCQAYDKKKLWMENAWDCTGNCGKMREG